MSIRLQVLPTKDAVIGDTADAAVQLLAQLTRERDRVDVCLTGGSVGIGILEAIASHPQLAQLELGRIHWWWGDERFVPSDSDDRNEKQAREALLDVIGVQESNINALPASDQDLDLDQAAAAASAELAEARPFALTFLGLGPDAHVASLFPEHPDAASDEHRVVAVRDSPKPPPERLSMTFAVLNASERVWIAAAGSDKADAVAAAIAAPDRVRVPAAGVRGTAETLLFADEAAASLVERSDQA